MATVSGKGQQKPGVADKAGARRRRKVAGDGESATKPPRRRPGFDPRAASVRGHERSDGADAFLPDPGDGPVRTDDDLAETLGEGFIAAATTGEDVNDEVLDAVVPEEIGGPFIESTASRELAAGIDESNPEDAEPEALPRAVAGLIERPPSDPAEPEDE